ncbi:hypothetical protein PFZ55_40070 [Streptomyces sp. MS2A]|nr:hypothetical protein [Streptomyces sp. MS2A]
MTDDGFEQIFPLGEPNDAYAQYFIGQSFLAPLTGGSVPVSNVSFEPGCRNNWHIHHGTAGDGDQILPKTANPDHMRTNAEVDFVISDGDMVALRALRDVDYGESSAFPVYSGR